MFLLAISKRLLKENFSSHNVMEIPDENWKISRRNKHR
jgi:hypothetical protein